MGDMLSQAEMNALLGDDADNETVSGGNDTTLTSQQIDILGEFGNILLSTAATTLATLVNQKVSITTPVVGLSTYSKLMSNYERPYVAVRVDYTTGLHGTNVLLLTQKDVKIISDLMMGGDALNIDNDVELSELDLSAISEAMNQMIGSSSTSISSMIDDKIDINTPFAFITDLNSDEQGIFDKLGLTADELVTTISFKMEIGTLIDSQIVQVIPYKFSLELIELLNKYIEDSSPSVETNKSQKQNMDNASINTQPSNQQQFQSQASQQQMVSPNINSNSNINVQPVQFQNFDTSSTSNQKENINIIMDVQLDVTVELGRTLKTIKEILEFSPGTIIELNKLAGEPIDILVNGKFIANGEVVVIDENFGIRITDIINVDNRI